MDLSAKLQEAFRIMVDAGDSDIFVRVRRCRMKRAARTGAVRYFSSLRATHDKDGVQLAIGAQKIVKHPKLGALS